MRGQENVRGQEIEGSAAYLPDMRMNWLAGVTRGSAVACGAVVLAALSPACALAATVEGAEPPPPANDSRSAAQHVNGLPATIEGTTVGATTEAGESESGCAGQTGSSVWYTLRTPLRQRVAVDLAAKGALDATVDVYHAVRSQLIPVSCQATDSHGKASLTFATSKNAVYLIRVAALQDSQRAPFTLDVFLPTPAVEPPGPRLPSGGVSGRVDRIQNINAAYSFAMRSGVSYLISLANETEGACVSGALYAPGVHSFEEGSPLKHIQCGGYRLFTPGPGQGGLYSFQITPRLSRSGIQRFHLQVAPAGPAETAPGLSLGNYADAHGRLDGRGVHVLRLYRMDVTSHSNLTLRLNAPQSADFNLQLRNEAGNVIECQCGGSGSQTLQRQMLPGRYYAVVSVRDATAGNYTLVRESRTITATSLSFSSAKAAAGQGLAIDVKVSPVASGPVTVDIERFDPVFGWQFYAEDHAVVSAGAASVPFTPPAVGRWRADASYAGSRTASPSSVGFSYLLVS
jgi:hypothetical protein